MTPLVWLAALSLTSAGPTAPGAPAAPAAPKPPGLLAPPEIPRPASPTGALRLVSTWGDARLKLAQPVVRIVPVGTQMFATGCSHALALWNWRTGEESSAVPIESDYPIPIASANGKQLAIEYDKDATAVYDVAARRFVKAVPPGRPLFLADGGALLATFVRAGSKYQLWDLARGSRLWERPGGAPDWNGQLRPVAALSAREGLLGLVASADGRYAAAISSFVPCELTVMDLRTLEPRKKARLGSCPRALRFAPGGRRLIGAGDEFITWDFETSPAPRAVKLEGATGQEGATVSPGDDRVVQWGRLGIAVWNAAGGKPLWTKQRPPAESHQSVSATFSSDGRHVVAGDWGKTERVIAWEADSGRQVFVRDRLAGHSLAFEPRATTMAVGDWDNGIVVLDAATGEPKLKGARFPGRASALALSADGRRLLAGTSGGSLVLFDTTTGAIAKVLRARDAEERGLKQVAFSADGTEIAAVVDTANGDYVDVWSPAAGKRTRRIAPPKPLWGRIMRILTGGRRVLAEDRRPAEVGELQDGAHIVTAFDLATGKTLSQRRVPRPEDDRSLLGSLVTDSGESAMYGESNKARIHDVETGAFKRSVDLPPTSGTLWISADDRLLAVLAEDGNGRVLDSRTGKTLVTFKGAPGYSPSAHFSPDGKWLVVWRWMGGLELWSLGTAAPPAPAGAWDFATRADSPVSLVFTPDGKRLFVGTARGLVHQLAIDGAR